MILKLYLVCVWLCLSAIEISAQNADIVLLIDSTDTFRSKYFESEKAFALDISQRLFHSGNRIAIYTYGSKTHMQFSLNTYTNVEDITQAINYMWFSTGDGELAPALNYTQLNGFSESSGNRECVPNVFVILTHSSLPDQLVAAEYATALDNQIIRTFVLSMGNSQENLALLTNDSSRVKIVASFGELENIAEQVVTLITSDLPRTGCGSLTTWQSWTSCSVSCGSGLQFRSRECIKVYPTDKDCSDDLTDDRICSFERCSDPLDGGWSNWGLWGTCSKTCENGTQLRTRTCDEPLPYNGGKECPGADTQTRSCAAWSCPDCKKVCPPGGFLSHDCEYCECSSVSLFGRLFDNVKEPVKQAKVFLESRKYSPITASDDWGNFNAGGICIMNENIHIEATGYSSESLQPKEVNGTHWTVNITMLKYVKPLYNVQPQSKVRMEGQSLSLCCKAVGTPTPTSYKWFKDEIELEHIGADGILEIPAVSILDAATYKCTTETEAGVSQSEDAIVQVKEAGPHTCSDPVSKLQFLPDGCYAADDPDKKNQLDVGTCGKAACISSSLHDNGTCSEWWSYHCCDVDNFETVDIKCEDYDYKTTRVTSCMCKLCVIRTTVSGRVIGRKDGVDVPFQFGEITSNGSPVGRTNMAGFFRFEVPQGTIRIVATFHDSFFKIFLDSTKIIQVVEGLETSVTIVLPLKPEPVPFASSAGTSVEIGGDGDSLPPAGVITIPENSLMTADGHPFIGQAKAAVHFMDPRKREDMEAANGEFVFESENGEKLPLETFGMFHVGVEDNDGNELRVTNPIEFSIDTALMDIPVDENGDPDLALWYYDSNKGIWVEQSKMKFSTQPLGGRRLLANVISGTVVPVDVPKMDPNDYNERVVQEFTGRYTNCDRNVPIFVDRVVRDPVPKNGVCYVSISVFTDMTLKEPLQEGSVTVTAFSQEKNKNKFIAVESRPTKNGHVCMMVFCDKDVSIYVEKKGVRLPQAQHFLPYPYQGFIKGKPADHEVKFESILLGKAYDCEMDDRSKDCYGPMFQINDAAKCRKNVDDSFTFSFAPFTKDPQLTTTVGSTDNYDQKLSWYPVSPDKNTFRSCFLKARIKVVDNYDIRVSATSHYDTFDGEEFGTYDVGPVPDPTSSDRSNRAACIEFRCAGYVKDGDIEHFDKPTAVQARITATNKALRCQLSWKHEDLLITPINDGKWFQFQADSGNNYGTSYGVFINDAPASTVQDFCYSGYDSGPNIDGFMKPDENAALEITCS